jgi:hypothetical protein
MPRQSWKEMGAWATADATAVANLAVATICFPDVVVWAYYAQDARNFTYHAFGKYSTTGTPTMLFSLFWGGTTGTLLCKSPAMQTQSGVGNCLWEVAVVVQVRTNGATGTIMANGRAVLYNNTAGIVGSATAVGNGLVQPMTLGGVTGPASATVDLTTDKSLSLALTWGTANASNTSTGLNQDVSINN